jgi:hypothetical protein
VVNVDRVKRKLPSLLLNGSTTDKKEWAKRWRIENGLERLRRRKPEKYRCLEARLIRDLEDMEKALFQQ